MAKGGYALDVRAGGFGLISLGYHACAAYSDPLTDHLYLVLDEVNEPDDELLPVPPEPIVDPDGLTIYQFDGDDTTRMTFRWKGKLNRMNRPATMHFMRVVAIEYDNLVANVYANGVMIDSFVVTGANDEATRIPGLDSYNTYELELVGTSSAQSMTAAERVDGAL